MNDAAGFYRLIVDVLVVVYAITRPGRSQAVPLLYLVTANLVSEPVGEYSKGMSVYV